MSNYKPAIFQPTVRPDWGGTLDYLSDEEKSQILTAIIKYPSVECNSKFWLGTIKPDLDMQLKGFLGSNAAKSRGALCRWSKAQTAEGKDMVSISIPYGNHLKEKEKSKEESDTRNDSIDIYTTRARAKNAAEIIKKTTQAIKAPSSRTILITEDLVFPTNAFFDAYRHELPDATTRAEQWLRKSNLVGKIVTVHKIGEIIQKFARK